MLESREPLKQTKGDFVFFMSADDEYNLHIVEWCRAASKIIRKRR